MPVAAPIAIRLSDRDRKRLERLRRRIEVKGRVTRESRADVVRRLLDLAEKDAASSDDKDGAQ